MRQRNQAHTRLSYLPEVTQHVRSGMLLWSPLTWTSWEGVGKTKTVPSVLQGSLEPGALAWWNCPHYRPTQTLPISFMDIPHHHVAQRGLLLFSANESARPCAIPLQTEKPMRVPREFCFFFSWRIGRMVDYLNKWPEFWKYRSLCKNTLLKNSICYINLFYSVLL